MLYTVVPHISKVIEPNLSLDMGGFGYAAIFCLPGSVPSQILTQKLFPLPKNIRVMVFLRKSAKPNFPEMPVETPEAVLLCYQTANNFSPEVSLP